MELNLIYISSYVSGCLLALLAFRAYKTLDIKPFSYLYGILGLRAICNSLPSISLDVIYNPGLFNYFGPQRANSQFLYLNILISMLGITLIIVSYHIYLKFKYSFYFLKFYIWLTLLAECIFFMSCVISFILLLFSQALALANSYLVLIYITVPIIKIIFLVFSLKFLKKIKGDFGIIDKSMIKTNPYKPEDILCPNCGNMIKADETVCKNCAWTYEENPV